MDGISNRYIKPYYESLLRQINQSVSTTDSPSFVAITLTQAGGTKPMTITSTTKVDNLNSDQTDGYHLNQDVLSTSSPSFSNVTLSQTLGSELITGAAAMSTWTPTAAWTYSTSWDHATGTATALASNWSPTAGVKYKIIITNTTSVAGTGFVVSCGGQSFAAISASETDTYYITAVSTAALTFTPGSGGTWVGSITSVSVMTVSNGALIGESSTLYSGSYLAPNGNVSYPAYASRRNPNTGLYFTDTQAAISVLGTQYQYWNATACFISKPIYFGGSLDAILGRSAAATLQMGIDAASPIDQTFKAHNASGANHDGAKLILQAGSSTGTGTPGDIKLQTAYTGVSSNSTVQTMYTRAWTVGKVWSISNNSATALFSIDCADPGFVAGSINYSIEVTDGTNYHVEQGIVTFAGVNKSTEAWVTDIDKGTVSQVINVAGGTLTTTWAVDTATADTFKVTLNSKSSLTPTYTKVRMTIFLNCPHVITLI